MPSPRALPFRAGPYECYHYLGGNLAEVYLGRDTRTGFNRVVKVLGTGFGVDPEFIQRFVAEGHAALQCTHPNIVMTYEAEQTDGLAYIAMEQLQGETLKVLLERGQLKSMAERINIAWQVARGLGYLHQYNILHRDIKPENVHLDLDGRAKIFDFGVARQKNQQITKEGQLLGTPLYMAPEQMRGEGVGTAADVYSFGVFLFVMFTGAFPIRGVSREDLYAALVFYPPDLSPLQGKGIPLIVIELITHCLQKQPVERPASFALIEARLRPLVTMAMEEPVSAPRPRSKWPLWVLAGLLLLGAGGAGGWYLRRDGAPPPRVLVTKSGYMVLVPAGPALIGRDRQAVSVDGFYIDRTEVSNEAFREYLASAIDRDLPATFPVVNVSYDEAAAYCAWAGKRLPTDIEWEKAARGTSGLLYPWGNEALAELVNMPYGNEPHELEPVESNLNGASPYGAINLLGNVWEWVAKAEHLEQADLAGWVLDPPAGLEERAYQIRGGSFQQAIDMRQAIWDFAAAPARVRRSDVGFRCARGL